MRVGLALVCAVFLATWLPHYPTWPWNRDHDTFAAMAQFWDEGIRPYRDVRAYNFPGQIYVFWVLGKMFGWGWSPAFFAIDALGLIALGIVLIAWSRRLFERSTAGWLGWLLVLEHYLDYGHFQAAERDWQSALLVAIGLLLVEARAKRASRIALAAMLACALTLRPHAFLFLPAIISTLDESARVERNTLKTSIVAMIEWGIVFLSFTLLAFSPLIAQGLVDDLARGVGEVAAGAYGKVTRDGVIRGTLRELSNASSWLPLLAIAACWIFEPRATRRSARTWTFALLAAILYKPLHPVPHDYLGHPLALVRAIAIARVAGSLLKTTRLSSILKLLILIGIFLQAAWKIPSKCDAIASLRAIPDLVRGEVPERAPIGCDPWYERPGNLYPKGDYPWKDYRDILVYIKTRTQPHERVANLLRRMPFPPINGATGRLDTFPVESGIAWLWMRPNDLEMEEFLAKTLERTPDSVVVWEPDGDGIDPRMALKKIGRVVRKRYEVVARFGRLEVLRRRRQSQPESGMESIAP